MNLIYPELPGLVFPIARRPTFTTALRAATSQREVRLPMLKRGILEIDLQYEVMTEAHVHALLGLFMRARGGCESFLFRDPGDSSCTLEAVATGDAVTTVFPLQRNLGASARAIDQVNAVSDVRVNGVSVAFAASLPRNIVLATAPASGAVVSASFTYYWRVYFADDALRLEEFMSKLYGTKSVRLRSAII